MKIGILTYHRSNNYGALLQSIALREVLARDGHDVFFIDYWPSYHRHMYDLFSFAAMMSCNGVRRKLGYLKVCIKNYRLRKERIENFNHFIAKFILPYISSIDETYDVVVHGSDQIWRKQPELGTYDPVYFGKHGIIAKQKVSYAASMGILPTVQSDKNILKNLISNLNGISVRESDLMSLIKDLGFDNTYHVLDPTLLLSSDFWETKFNLRKSNEHYALCYMLQDSFNLSALRDYSKEKGLKLKVICRPTSHKFEEMVVTADPQNFLQLVYGADIVFTSSFHGLAFSLIFHKPFWASYIRKAGRATSLLSLTGLERRLLSPNSIIPEDTLPIDYDSVDEKLKNAQNGSLSILLSMCNQR